MAHDEPPTELAEVLGQRHGVGGRPLFAAAQERDGHQRAGPPLCTTVHGVQFMLGSSGTAIAPAGVAGCRSAPPRPVRGRGRRPARRRARWSGRPGPGRGPVRCGSLGQAPSAGSASVAPGSATSWSGSPEGISANLFRRATGERAIRAISWVGGQVRACSPALRRPPGRGTVRNWRQAAPSWRATCGSLLGPNRIMATMKTTGASPGSGPACRPILPTPDTGRPAAPTGLGRACRGPPGGSRATLRARR